MAKPTVNKNQQKTAPQQNKGKPSTEVAKVEKTGTDVVSAAVAAAAAKHAGKGISHDASDNIVPLIYLLQANSKPALKGHDKYIKGAEGGGKIWLRNAPPEIALIDGEEGMLFQPCHFSKCWIEWMPDRGGFVARHDERPEAAVLTDEEDDNGNPRKVWRMPNGNSVNESREFAGLVHIEDLDEPLPYTLPFSGSGHTVAKGWMTMMRAERLPGGEEAPMFANIYRVTAKLRTKGENSWFMYEIAKERAVDTVEDIERGAALHDAFEMGVKKSAAVDDLDTGEGEAVDGEM